MPRVPAKVASLRPRPGRDANRCTRRFWANFGERVRVPVVVVRGLRREGTDGAGAQLVRDVSTDLFPHGRGWLARRLATGEGRAVRTGPVPDWEWALVERACGVGRADDRTLRTDDGLAAGLALACLLDLGHDVVAERDGDGHVVRLKA